MTPEFHNMPDSERWRRFRKMARNLAGLITIADPLDFNRASGLAACDSCGLELQEHPQLADGLYVRCDGKRFHL